MSKQYFTLTEANGCIPHLAEVFGRVMQIRAQLKILYRRLDAQKLAPADEHFSIVVPGAPVEALRDRASFKALLEVLKEQLGLIHATGAVIKDIDTGLVDWWSQQGGRDICLCWQFGEKEVAWWHDPETGFSGRRPISELMAELTSVAEASRG